MTTNLERIRQMNSEELADFLTDDICLYCAFFNTKRCKKSHCSIFIKTWLEKEVEE